ncbi:MAG: hypothetical protein UW69_C0084G0003 [Microgenomates group bacterium GW2011_GWA2_44_7]|nr:MAG: hypothetical protein UW69_C0084G0003 [Microgenomates group bacterium GW2011_GWA2_44_7]KKT77974.1 MAG: hypothetical protein UW73_C0009G0073 [Microgenomates group bacterium GW2011_GWB1_44_8]
MKPRTLTTSLQTAISTFPAIVLTGPRQSGKTTLLKSEFGGSHKYISLENPDVRLRAKDDPAGFIGQIEGPAILDEIQYVPELLSYIKSSIDENRAAGKWLLTGSQNFALVGNISESLAGRSAVLHLLPFTVSELLGRGGNVLSTEQMLDCPKQLKPYDRFDLPNFILRGCYPEIASNPQVNRSLWCGSYITTYLERDIRNLKQVGDLGQYELFLRSCATRTGQVLDLSAISREIGVSFTTAKRWLSLLETGFQVLLLYPYYKNIGKRLIKRPKIYFTDTGLVSYLLGINSPETLMASPYLGSLFETLIVIDFWKRFQHHGQQPSMYYLRTEDKLEVDLVVELENKISLIEIKSSATITPSSTTSIIRAQRDLGEIVQNSILISNSDQVFEMKGGLIHLPAQRVLSN